MAAEAEEGRLRYCDGVWQLKQRSGCLKVAAEAEEGRLRYCGGVDA